MEIRVSYHFEDGVYSEPDAIITDGSLIPLVGDKVATGAGGWTVKERYFALRDSPVAVRILLHRPE